ncbi:HNH endonuclease [Deinococcus multiflagellatus]|uniref:HNH endonuclease n=1 Tax=Deinococcus multiflagellatus TaxID=1656887 RepID=A0ABW1ZS81_9DEIO|nr:HNH endonuclease [Deinococcus multiflagellatus]MBZ9712690.1 HNH endonuclease [Deinococcus multiflagellatus]
MARHRADSAWPPPPRAPQRCALCGREVPQLTEHHLLPRSQGRRQGLKATELPTALLCPPCHKFLHRTFTNAELARDYADLDALRAHEDVARFVAWIRKQPATKAVRVR